MYVHNGYYFTITYILDLASLFILADLANDQLSLCSQATLSAFASSPVLASASFVYSAPHHMVDASELIYGIYIGFLPPLICIK